MVDRKPYPRWLLVLGLGVIVAAHTQVTLRHGALRLAGVRYGRVDRVMTRAEYEQTTPRFDRRPLAFGATNGTVLLDATAVHDAGRLNALLSG